MAGVSLPLAGDARFHAQVGLEFFLREPQKQVAIHLLLLGEESEVRKKGEGPLFTPGPPSTRCKGKEPETVGAGSVWRQMGPRIEPSDPESGG